MEAMGLVRAHLGSSAVIVSTQEDDNGGARVTAAVDDDLLPIEETRDQRVKPIARALAFHAVAPELAETILRACLAYPDTDALSALAAGLATTFRFEPLTQRKNRATILVGPPGSGKTATAAKLAARSVIAGERVRLITTDMIRAGGAAQLDAFAKILDTPFQAVDGPENLARALGAADPAERIVIDTSGVNPFSAGDCRELEALLAHCRAEPILVFPAGGDRDETVAMAEVFRDLGCARAIISRIDTVRRIGGALTVAHTLDLGLAEAGVAPDIADGLLAFAPNLLARLLLPRGMP
jgi:flagellar biosynthesis protein FlhF